MKNVGVVGSIQGNGIGVGKNYHEYARTLGHVDGKTRANVITINPSDDPHYHAAIIAKIDLLILPGGADLSPSHYGEEPLVHTGNPDVFKEAFFTGHLKDYVNAGVPTFGICLGFQMINVFFGGSLLQHIMFGDHQSDIRWRDKHNVLSNGEVIFNVNSHHHQGVTLDRLGEGLRPMVISKVDGKFVGKTSFPKSLKEDVLIEGFMHEDLAVGGVQWHPEEWYDKFSGDLIEVLMKRGTNKKTENIKEISWTL